MSYINNPPNINETFIIEPLEMTGTTGPVISACTAVYTNEINSCDGDATILLNTGIIEINSSIIPLIDAVNDLGTNIIRFRNINTVSGNSTVWSSSQKIITPIIDLGLDSEGNYRTITANNSIIQNDDINGGTY